MNNTSKITVNGLTFHFSYTTLVAIEDSSIRVVHKNIWSRTTAKHLNNIDGGWIMNRVNADEFNRVVLQMCAAHGVDSIPTLN